MRRLIGGVVNAALGPLGLKVVRLAAERPWDAQFERWIADARAAGQDPNDVADAQWGGSPLEAAETHYLPHITAQSVVLELGPGTGRLTRHLIGRCGEMKLVDYSPVACEWLETYLKGKGRYAVHRIDTPSLADIGSGSVDVVVASGVFHFMDLYETHRFLEEFHRVLRSGGVAAFNFVHIGSDVGLQWFKRWRPEPGGRPHWHFHHPDDIQRLVDAVGFEALRLTVPLRLTAFIEARKP